MTNKFWMVYCPAQSAPKCQHDTREAAETEAKRLSLEFPNKEYFVLETITKVTCTIEQKVECLSPNEPDKDGWIVWHGGECPVSADDFVDLQFQDGVIYLNKIAHYYNWHHKFGTGNIIKYREVKNA